MTPDNPIVSFESQQAWQAWPAEEHEHSTGVWLAISRKKPGVDSLTYDQALDVALCYGWIDGQKRPLDATAWIQRFTPRRAKSKWSKINTEKAETLIAARRMQVAGLRQVEQAKADGRWQAAYCGQRTTTVPDDLQEALDANPTASAFFATLTGANRYAILYRVQDAKRPETRAARIQKFIAMLASGDTLH